MKIVILICTLLYMGSCNKEGNNKTPEVILSGVKNEAAIVSVTTTGVENSYTFNVGVSSPDTGCDQYANWWEIVSNEGKLIYRRILRHSHVKEQPFIRSGSSIHIASTQEVIIRVHMNTTGYSAKGYKGSIAKGFSAFDISDGFASELKLKAPLPKGCAF